jgi:hypothetical protein
LFFRIFTPIPPEKNFEYFFYKYIDYLLIFL